MGIKNEHAQNILKKATEYEQNTFGITYSLNPFKGCIGRCAYCHNSNKENPQSNIKILENVADILINDLLNNYKGGIIGLGTKTEPFQNVKQSNEIITEILKIFEKYKAPVHIFTKTNLVLKSDIISLLKNIAKTYLAVTLSISTVDKNIASIFEPNSPAPEKRLATINVLSKFKINSGIHLCPILPYIADDFDDIENVIKMAKAYNTNYVIYSPGLEMNTDFSQNFYSVLKTYYPSLINKYANFFNQDRALQKEKNELLSSQIDFLCNRYGIETSAPKYKNFFNQSQLSMFND